MSNKKELMFVNKLNNDELLHVVNKFLSEDYGTVINSKIMDHFNGENDDLKFRKIIAISSKCERGRSMIFNYEFTDTSLNSYYVFTRGDHQSYDSRFQEYLLNRFGDSYQDYLSQQLVNQEEAKARVKKY